MDYFLKYGIQTPIKRLIFLSACLWIFSFSYCEERVYLEGCDKLSFDESINKDAQLLWGNVRFRHDSMHMFCDSAYFYEKDNSLDAFGNVRLEQGDSLFGFADVMYYNGNERLARFRHNVKLIHKATTLTTDSLNFDRKTNIAYYYDGGTIVDSLNSLQSQLGTYVIDSSLVKFFLKVRLNHPNFVLLSDTLLYNTRTNIANIMSETKIIYSKESDIYSHNGWYDTRTEQSHLFNRSYIIHEDHKYLCGDTIFYDKKNKYSRIYGNMVMADSTKHIDLYGQYGEMYEKKQIGFATDRAYVMDRSDISNYAYLHADTIFTENRKIFPNTKNTPNDSLSLTDSTQLNYLDSTIPPHPTYKSDSLAHTDSNFLLIRAFHNVRFFRNDLQGQCDSLVYDRRDSSISLFYNPICWSDSTQLVADTIVLYTDNESIKLIEGLQHAFATERLNHTYFNQVSGKRIVIHVDSNNIDFVDVFGNVETIYYPQEKDEEGSIDYIGMNKLMCSALTAYMENNKIHHILFLQKPSAVMYPLDQIPKDEATLNGFFWNSIQRPNTWQDIFTIPPKITKPDSKTISAAVQKSQEDIEKEKKQKKATSHKKNRIR